MNDITSADDRRQALSWLRRQLAWEHALVDLRPSDDRDPVRRIDAPSGRNVDQAA